MTILLPVLTALLFGLNALPAKTLAERGWNEYCIAWVNVTVQLVPLSFIALGEGRGEIAPAFWPWLLAGMIGNAFAFTLFYRALAIADISIVMPLVSLSPAFMLITSWVMLGESLSLAGISGVVLIAVGAYVLGASDRSSSVFSPFTALAVNRGARTALVVSLIWAITSNIDKKCVLLSSSSTYPFVFSTAMSLFYLPLFLLKKGTVTINSSARGTRFIAILLGISSGMMIACQMTSLDYYPAAIVIAIKRSGMLVGVIVGISRGERGGWRRIVSALILFSGVVIIVLWS